MISGRIQKNYEYALLLLILIVSAWLRFHHLGEISFSNDELSALKRTRFDSFYELVEKGIKVDGHPALVQTMMWLTVQHFNDNVFTIRFPFAIAGIISVFLIFLLARRWFGNTTALLSAAAMATLQFPVLYSQTARPYIIGLMFTIATAFFWTKVLFDDRRSNWSHIWYILSASACMYTHYFSLMMAGIIGISGLFFLKKKNFIHYLLDNVIVLLLFIPHIDIFKAQFAYGGIGSWLAAPKPDFLSKFINYGFNDSTLIYTLVASVLVCSFIIFINKNRWKKFQSLCIAWYIVPLIIGYYYSVKFAPVLQYSTLLFSFPFIIIFTFSFIKDEWMNKKVVTVLTFIVLASCTYSTVIENKYYRVNHFGVFKELAEKVKEWDNKFGRENITTTFTLTTPEYINYYFRKLNHEPNVALYTDNERENFGKFEQLIENNHTEYFAYAWTNAPHQYETLELIQESFPIVVERDTFFNSEITLFKRGTNAAATDGIIASNDLEKNNWDNESEKQNKDMAHSGTFSQKMDDKTEFSVTYKTMINKINLNAGEMIKAEAWFNASDSLQDATLVISFAKNGKAIQWNGMPLKYFFTEKNKWQRVILCAPVPENANDAELGIYIWNPGKKAFYIDDLKISVSRRNPLYREL